MSKNTFEITSANFQTEVAESKLPVLVDFTAEWCPPCKMLNPIVDELAQKYEGVMRVGAVDVDENPELQQLFGVMGLPTLILFQEGQPVKRVVGFRPGERLEAELAPFLQPQNT